MDTNEMEKYLKIRTCIHPAWKMLIVGLPPIIGDIGWQCTQCRKVIQGINPFNEEIENGIICETV